MAVRASVRIFSTPISMTGWRGGAWLAIALAIVIALPEARALITTGFLGGLVIGAFLILWRHNVRSSGPGSGTPILLLRPEPRRRVDLLAPSAS